jgi:hypothetical protein
MMLTAVSVADKWCSLQGDIAQLVYYERPNVSGPKVSKYILVPVNNPAELKVCFMLDLCTNCCRLRFILNWS